MNKNIFILTIAMLLAFFAFGFTAQLTNNEGIDTTETKETSQTSEIVLAYYFHGDVRCATCRRLESYSHLAIETGFKEKIDDSTLIWKSVNFDEKANKHFIDDYKLYTKAVILSRVKDGKEIEWKNLDKIWNLVGNKDRFMDYVQSETQNFLDTDNKNE